MARTVRLWREHGRVMTLAVEPSPSVPAIDEHWRDTVQATVATTTRVAVAAGIPDVDGPLGASALATSRVWMTERTFYQAFRREPATLDAVAETNYGIWRCVLTADLRSARAGGPAGRRTA